MNNTTSRNLTLASRLREVFLNGHWVAGTNYKLQLEHLNWINATKKIDHLNSIAALTFHINYFLEGLLSAFKNGKLEISDRYSFDLSKIQSEEDWNKLVGNFLNNAEQFATNIEQMDNATFDEPFVDEKYGSYLRNIECIIEHSYYHLGQIVLIGKILALK
jgi:hypothetical protein